MFTFEWHRTGRHIVVLWECEHMRKRAPILLFKHRKIYDIPSHEWLLNRYAVPCSACVEATSGTPPCGSCSVPSDSGH